MTHRDSPLDRRLDNLRAVLGPEAVEDALRFLPSTEVEELAASDEREREEAERTATALTMRETRDAVLAGGFGIHAKAKLMKAIVDHCDANHGEVLILATKLAAAERKAEYYRRLNGTQKEGKAP